MVFDEIIGVYFSNYFVIVVLMEIPIILYLLNSYKRGHKKIDGNELFFIITMIASGVFIYTGIGMILLGIYCGFIQKWPQVPPPPYTAFFIVVLGAASAYYMYSQIRDRIKEKSQEETGVPEKVPSPDDPH